MVLSENFTLDGITGKSKDICLVTFDSDVLVSVGVPFQREVSSDQYSQDNPIFKTTDSEPDDIVLNFLHIKDGTLLQWTDEKLMEIKKWLITDNFIPFESGDTPGYIYYVKCTKIENKMTSGKYGVLEVTFKPYSHFAYKIEDIYANSGETVEIDNLSVFEYKPKIKITNLGNTSTVNKIGTFEIRGLNQNESVIVDNLTMTVLSSSGENKFSNCNRSWLTLQPGINNIQTSGNCNITIYCEFPVVL